MIIIIIMTIIVMLGELIAIITPNTQLELLKKAKEHVHFVDFSPLQKFLYFVSIVFVIVHITMFFTGNVIIGLGILVITIVSFVNLHKNLTTTRYIRFESVISLLLLTLTLL